MFRKIALILAAVILMFIAAQNLSRPKPVDEDTYLVRMDGWMEKIDTSLAASREFTNTTNITDEALHRYLMVLSTWQTLKKDIDGTVPPPKYAAIHEDWMALATDFNTIAAYLTARKYGDLTPIRKEVDADYEDAWRVMERLNEKLADLDN